MEVTNSSAELGDARSPRRPRGALRRTPSRRARRDRRRPRPSGRPCSRCSGAAGAAPRSRGRRRAAGRRTRPGRPRTGRRCPLANWAGRARSRRSPPGGPRRLVLAGSVGLGSSASAALVAGHPLGAGAGVLRRLAGRLGARGSRRCAAARPGGSWVASRSRPSVSGSATAAARGRRRSCLSSLSRASLASSGPSRSCRRACRRSCRSAAVGGLVDALARSCRRAGRPLRRLALELVQETHVAPSGRGGSLPVRHPLLATLAVTCAARSRSWPSSAPPLRQDRPLPRPRRAARRRGRQHRRDAGLPRHGHRHGEAAASPSAAASRTTSSTCSTSREPLTVAEFQERARAVDRRAARARGATPVLVGGSALYTRAILDRFEFPGTDPEVRARLEAELDEVGSGGAARPAARARPRGRRPDPGRERPPRRPRARGHRDHRAARTAPACRGWSTPTRAPSRSASTSTGRPSTPGSSSGSTGCSRRGSSTRCERLLDEGLAEGRTASRAIGYREVAAYLAGELTPRPGPRAHRTATRRFARRQDCVVPQGPAHHLGAVRRPRARRRSSGRGGEQRAGERTERAVLGLDRRGRRVQGGPSPFVSSRRTPCSPPHPAASAVGATVAAPDLGAVAASYPPAATASAPAAATSAAWAAAVVRRRSHPSPTAVGRGGAVSSVDPDATRVGLRVLKQRRQRRRRRGGDGRRARA